MVDRREFLKSLIGASFFSFIPAPFMNTINLYNDETLPSSELIISKEGPRNRRIFCLFDNPELEAEIERCAEEIGCEVLHGEPCSPDILVLGGFVNIVDRKLVGEDYWELYTGFHDEYGWDDSCFIVDNSENMIFPKSLRFVHFDLNDPISIRTIVISIKVASGRPLFGV